MKSKHSLFALFVAAALSFGAVGSFVAISALAKGNFCFAQSSGGRHLLVDN
jgi:hypothetical protein